MAVIVIITTQGHIRRVSHIVAMLFQVGYCINQAVRAVDGADLVNLLRGRLLFGVCV